MGVQPLQDLRFVVLYAPSSFLTVVEVRLREIQPTEEELYLPTQGYLVHLRAHHEGKLSVLVVVEILLQEHLVHQPRLR